MDADLKAAIPSLDVSGASIRQRILKDDYANADAVYLRVVSGASIRQRILKERLIRHRDHVGGVSGASIRQRILKVSP